jgi:hypothetical protein
LTTTGRPSFGLSRFGVLMRAVSRLGEGRLRSQYSVSARSPHQRSDVSAPHASVTGARAYIGRNDRCRRSCPPLPEFVAGLSDCPHGRSHGAGAATALDRRSRRFKLCSFSSIPLRQNANSSGSLLSIPKATTRAALSPSRTGSTTECRWLSRWHAPARVLGTAITNPAEACGGSPAGWCAPRLYADLRSSWCPVETGSSRRARPSH